MPKTIPCVVFLLAEPTLQVVWLGLAHFRLPVPVPEIPFPADTRKPRHAVRGGLGGASARRQGGVTTNPRLQEANRATGAKRTRGENMTF